MKAFLFRTVWRRISKMWAFFLGLLVLLISSPQEAQSTTNISQSSNDSRIFEMIRLHVPKSSKQAWLNAEKGSWEPWLVKQNGFIDRQLFWDQQREEAMLLISWASREQWKEIPQSDVDFVQKHFEELAREGTGKDLGNPFPIKYEAELLPQ